MVLPSIQTGDPDRTRSLPILPATYNRKNLAVIPSARPWSSSEAGFPRSTPNKCSVSKSALSLDKETTSAGPLTLLAFIRRKPRVIFHRTALLVVKQRTLSIYFYLYISLDHLSTVLIARYPRTSSRLVLIPQTFRAPTLCLTYAKPKVE